MQLRATRLGAISSMCRRLTRRWLMFTGFWNDAGKWDDNATWNDGD